MIHLKNVTKVYQTNGGNVTLHPIVAPQLVNCSNVVTATERNAAHC